MKQSVSKKQRFGIFLTLVLGAAFLHWLAPDIRENIQEAQYWDGGDQYHGDPVVNPGGNRMTWEAHQELVQCGLDDSWMERASSGSTMTYRGDTRVGTFKSRLIGDGVYLIECVTD